jgi:hypothetical protein
MTTTYREALDRAGVTVPDETLADLEVPVLTGVQRQGDVLIVPRGPLTGSDAERAAMVPADGVPVVRGEATGNTHLLMTDRGSGVSWLPATGLLLGVLTVPDGAVAHLIHTDEHGVNAIGPGIYEMRGKREQAEEVRRVAD